MILAFRHQHERAARSSSPSAASSGSDGIEGENRRRRVGGRAGVGSWNVVEGGVVVDVELLLLGLRLGVVVSGGGTEVVVSEGRGIVVVVVGVLMMMVMMTVIMIMMMRSEKVGVVVVEGSLSGGVVFQNVLSGRVGSGMLLLLVPGEHDRRRVPPFVV